MVKYSSVRRVLGSYPFGFERNAQLLQSTIADMKGQIVAISLAIFARVAFAQQYDYSSSTVEVSLIKTQKPNLMYRTSTD